VPGHRGATDDADHVVGVVLAAGASSRLGRIKQTLPFGDTSLLGWTVRNVERSALDRVVVVLGAAAEEVRSSLGPTTASTVVNEDHRSGPLSSLQAGMDAAGACGAIMVLLGDMPGVDETVIDTVLTAWRRDRSWAAVTDYRDRLGHPFVFSAEAFPTLLALHGEKAVWKMVHRQPESRVRHVGIDRPCPGDVDTWDDYVQVAQRMGVAIRTQPDGGRGEGAQVRPRPRRGTV
jgi:molybdenum cofactor cytidylyltransferase